MKHRRLGAYLIADDLADIDALTNAAKQDDIPTIDMILAKCPTTLDAFSSYGRTALMIAVAWGNFNAVQYLLRYVDPITTFDVGVYAE